MSQKSIGELSAERFGGLLKTVADKVAHQHSAAGLSNREWTRAQWRALSSELLKYAPQEPGSWFWFGYHGANEDGLAKACISQAGSEWLYDYSFIEYLKASDNSGPNQTRFGELIVAAESEWNPAIGSLEEDFEKLLASRARFKVFFCDPGSTERTQNKAKARLAECVSGGLQPQDTRLWLVNWARSADYTIERLEFEPRWGELHKSH